MSGDRWARAFETETGEWVAECPCGEFTQWYPAGSVGLVPGLDLAVHAALAHGQHFRVSRRA